MVVGRQHEVDTLDKLVVVGGENGFVSLINLYERSIVYRFSVASAVNVVTFYGCGMVLIGSEDGKVVSFKIADLKSPHKMWHDSNSSVQSVLAIPSLDGFVVGRGDGSCVFYSMMDDKKRVVLTGADIDPVTSLAADLDHVYAGARDGCIRKYALNRLKF